MSTYVLIHGAWHGGWCWDKVVPLLKQAGHTALAPDLPGQGNDKTPIPEITLHSYVNCVCEIVNAQTEPVILVGHSSGGTIITQAAEKCPERIKALVYLSAFLPGDGESSLHWSKQNTEALVSPNRIMAADQSYSTIRAEAIQEVFYEDCSDEDVARAKLLHRPEATAPFVTPVSTTLENFGRVPRFYIETLQDKAVSISLQRRMYSLLPCSKVMTMDTSHSPFFSAPEALVAHLTSL